MRPTNLGFRSPKERTAEFNYPCVTFDGRTLPYIGINPNSTGSRGRRFLQYEVVARRTGTSVGPGAYNITKDPIRQ